MQRIFLIILVCGVAALVGCGSSSSSSSSSTGGGPAGEAKTTSAVDAAIETKPKVVVPSGPPPKRLVSRDLVKGTGAEAKLGDEVTVKYVGVDYKTGRLFESSWEFEEPFTYRLGDEKKVIRGWNLGIAGMRVGGRRELIVPPQLAYGDRQEIWMPPNTTLVFVIDLVAVK